MESKKMNEVSFKEYETYWANKSLSSNQKKIENLRSSLRILGKILKIVVIVSIIMVFAAAYVYGIKNGQMTSEQAFSLTLTAGCFWLLTKM